MIDKKISLLFLSMFLLLNVSAQNFIGLHKDDVKKLMRTSNPNFILDEGAVNKCFRYLKYVDNLGNQTLLYFLSADDVCTSSKMMSDYMYLNETTNRFNKKYKKTGMYSWVYYDKNQKYAVQLNCEKWFFTVIIKRK